MRSFFRSRRPFKLTKGGWIFILYTIGVGAGAINTGNNLLYLIFGLFLGLIMASGVLSDLTLWGLDALPIAPRDGRVGEPLIYPMSIQNRKKWFPSLGIRVEVRGTLNGQAVSALGFCTAVPPHHSVDSLPIFHPRERGTLFITHVVLSTRFPFGLLFKLWTIELPVPVETMILPRLLMQELPFPFSLSAAGSSERAASQRGEGTTVFGVREYQPSDHPRRIHWKASAKRTGGWLVREMEEEEIETVRLRWPEGFVGLSHGDFEFFVSYAATLVRAVESRRQRAVMIGGGVDSPWMLEGELIDGFLATVQPTQSDKSELRGNVAVETIDLLSAFQSAREDLVA